VLRARPDGARIVQSQLSHARSSQKQFANELSNSCKEAQQAASLPFFVAPCSVGVPSGCSTRSSGSMVTMIMLKSDG
jgi:hypothetical protein